MAIGDVNLSEVVSVLPADVLENIGGLIFVLKAVGIAAIAYVIYAIIMGIFSFSKMKKLAEIERRVILIDEKLDRLLKKKR